METEKIVYYELLENLAIISGLSQHDADEELSEIEVEGLIAEDPRNSALDRSISDHFLEYPDSAEPVSLHAKINRHLQIEN